MHHAVDVQVLQLPKRCNQLRTTARMPQSQASLPECILCITDYCTPQWSRHYQVDRPP
jgi:hypothetical protein